MSNMLIFLSFILCGLIIGILFDFFRVSRKNIPTHLFVVYVEDIIFCLFSGFLVLMMCYCTNYGNLRGFMFVGLGLGIILYFLIFSKIIFKIFDFLVSFVIKLFTKVWKVVFKYGKKTKENL